MSNDMRTVLLELILAICLKIAVVCFRFDWIQEVDHLTLSFTIKIK